MCIIWYLKYCLVKYSGVLSIVYIEGVQQHLRPSDVKGLVIM